MKKLLFVSLLLPLSSFANTLYLHPGEAMEVENFPTHTTKVYCSSDEERPRCELKKTRMNWYKVYADDELIGEFRSYEAALERLRSARENNLCY